MTTMATPLSAVNIILLLYFLISAGAFNSSLLRLGLGECALLSTLLISALSSSASWWSNFWQADSIDVIYSRWGDFWVLQYSLALKIKGTLGPETA